MPYGSSTTPTCSVLSVSSAMAVSRACEPGAHVKAMDRSPWMSPAHAHVYTHMREMRVSYSHSVSACVRARHRGSAPVLLGASQPKNELTPTV